MRALVQRVLSAEVWVEENVVGSCEKGLLVYIGVHQEDTIVNAEKMARKLAGLRIFDDAEGRINCSMQTAGLIPQVLAISNFTLYGECGSGYRPSFVRSADYQKGQELFEYFVECLKQQNVQVQTGVFGADMKIVSKADGPINLVIDL